MEINLARTKIISTLGPATADIQTQEKLILNGMSVARLNFAHGDHPTHAQHIRNIRTLALKLHRPIGILQDLPGPKLRVAWVYRKEIHLAANHSVMLTANGSKKSQNVIRIDYPHLTNDLKKGHLVYIADGTIHLVVNSIKGSVIHCTVITGGTVRPGNGVNLPDSSLSLRAFTKEDEKHFAFGLKQGIDFVGVSFIENGDDIRRVRSFANRRGAKPFIIAKIERQQAIRNLKDIIKVADGIMVARGDLGVEVPFAEIPGIQEKIVTLARRMGKPVIVATQVLESMVHSPRPTRAEATDIDNSIRNGADAIMLSGETSVGKYPLEAVHSLQQVILASEKRKMKIGWDESQKLTEPSDLFALEACHIAEKLNANLIVVPSTTGATTARVSKFQPPMPIISLLTKQDLRRRFSIYSGVRAISILRTVRFENMVAHVRTILLKNRWVKKGQRVLVISGAPGIKSNQTGMVQIIDI